MHRNPQVQSVAEYYDRNAEWERGYVQVLVARYIPQGGNYEDSKASRLHAGAELQARAPVAGYETAQYQLNGRPEYGFVTVAQYEAQMVAMDNAHFPLATDILAPGVTVTPIAKGMHVHRLHAGGEEVTRLLQDSALVRDQEGDPAFIRPIYELRCMFNNTGLVRPDNERIVARKGSGMRRGIIVAGDTSLTFNGKVHEVLAGSFIFRAKDEAGCEEFRIGNRHYTRFALRQPPGLRAA